MGPRCGSSPLQARTGRTRAVSAIPATRQSSQAGKNDPSTFRTGAHPPTISSGAIALGDRSVTRMSGGSRAMLPYRLRPAPVHWVTVTLHTSPLGRPPRGSLLQVPAPALKRAHRGRWRRAPVTAYALAVATASLSGCGALDAARRPYATAPPAAAVPWKPSESQREALRTTPRVPPPTDLDPEKVHGLPELIDLAQRMNP